MTTSTFDGSQLMDRIGKLERQIEWLKLDTEKATDRVKALERQRSRTSNLVWVAILLAFLGYSFLSPKFSALHTVPHSLEAKQFILRSADDDRIVACLSGWGNAPLLELKDQKGLTRVEMAVERDDTPMLRLFGSDRKVRAKVWVQQDGRPLFQLSDNSGNVVLQEPR